jgi:hypothetical protein
VRTILAIVAAVAMLAFGSITAGSFQAGHLYNADQIVADGDNGAGT